jgi:hypothetical protein
METIRFYNFVFRWFIHFGSSFDLKSWPIERSQNKKCTYYWTEKSTNVGKKVRVFLKGTRDLYWQTRFFKIDLNKIWICRRRTSLLSMISSWLIYYTTKVLHHITRGQKTHIRLDIVAWNKYISNTPNAIGKREIISILQVTSHIFFIVCVDERIHEIVVEPDQRTTVC